MPFHLVFELSSIIYEIRDMLQKECPLAKYFTERDCIEYWLNIAIERIMMLESTSRHYPCAEDYLFFSMTTVDPLLSKQLLYPQIMTLIRGRGYQTFNVMLGHHYDGVLVFDY